MIRSLVKQTSWYFTVHLFGTAIGFFSFPLWTRYFSLEEYGMLSLIGVTLSFVGPISKFGLNRSVLRLYAEFSSGKRERPIASFYTTMFLGAMALSGMVALLFWAVIYLLGPARVGGQQMYELFVLSSILLFLGAGPSVFISFLRVEERAKFYAGISISVTTIKLILTVVLVIVLVIGVKGLYLGGIIVQIGMVLLVASLLWRQKKLVLSSFSLALLVEALHFGLPLVPAELANEISNLGDRYVLEIFMGTKAVGIYSVAYSLTSNLKALLTVMMFALTPMYVRIWEESGRARTESFLSSVLDYYLMFAIPGIVLFSYLGGDILVFFASEKYVAARGLVPYLTVPLLLHGAISIYTAGLFLNKKTSTVLYCTLGAGTGNIALNIALVPVMGLTGAAVATLISYTLLIVAVNLYSSRFLTIRLNMKAVATYFVTSVIAVLSVKYLSMDFFGGVLVKAVVGALVYSVFIYMLDRRIRDKVRVAFGSNGNSLWS